MMQVFVEILLQEENRLRQRRQQMVKKRHLRDMYNPFDIGDDVFKKHYRMYPYMAVELINLVHEVLLDSDQRAPPHLQVLMTQRFLAEGGYQKGVGNDINHPMSQSTCSRYLHQVIPAINMLSDLFIKFPSTLEQRMAVQRRFQERIGFPGVLGAVDCTLPKIIAPSDHEEAYLNYKRQHSLCLQIVADMDYNILSCRICRIWRWSDTRQHMYDLRENEDVVRNEGLFYIIGDGGYTPSRVLLTPVQRPVPGTPAHAFSVALKATRFIVENVFGIVKERWRCLNSLRGLHYDPIMAAQITQACLILHNFLRNHGMPVPVVENAAGPRADELINEERVNNDHH